jgi:hypothetical protein
VLAGQAAAGGAAVRRLPALLLAAAVSAPAFVPAPASAQQCGLPPGPGWAGAGAAALIDPQAPPSGSLQDPGSPALWFAVARPWGVPGLCQAEGALALPLGERAGGAAWWRQVSGDGLVRAHGALRLSLSAAPGVRWIFSGGLHLLASPDRPVPPAPEVSTGLLVDRAPVSLGIRAVCPVGKGFTHGEVAWAVGFREGHGWVRVAGRRESGRGDEIGLVLARQIGGLALAAGAWGRPLQPVWALVVPTGSVTTTLEGRWSAGLGALLLLGVRLGPPVGP